MSVKSSRDLNSGEWQQVWIDYNEYHVRFTVNQESILVDLNDGEEFGPFEATLFIGGAPEYETTLRFSCRQVDMQNTCLIIVSLFLFLFLF